MGYISKFDKKGIDNKIKERILQSTLEKYIEEKEENVKINII